jgi:hypothetical protein
MIPPEGSMAYHNRANAPVMDLKSFLRAGHLAGDSKKGVKIPSVRIYPPL